MSTKYKNSSDVPIDVIVARLKELSDAITGGRESQSREFTMRIPAECDRDADLVISEAANRIEQLRAANRDLQARVAELEDLIRYAQVESGVCMCGEDIQTHNQVSGHSPVDIWDHARGAVLESSTSKPFILHKQAEAVTHCLHRLRLATTADGCRNHIESEVRRLLGEAENAGGEQND